MQHGRALATRVGCTDVPAGLRQGAQLRRKLERVGERRARSDRAMTQPAAAPMRTTAIVRASWRGDRRYETGKPDGPQALIDGDGVAAQSPPEALLSALATCSAVDVVDILAKRKTPVTALVVDVAAGRPPAGPPPVREPPRAPSVGRKGNPGTPPRRARGPS